MSVHINADFETIHISKKVRRDEFGVRRFFVNFISWLPAIIAIFGGAWALYQAHDLKKSEFVREVRQKRFQTYEEMLGAVAQVNSGPLNPTTASLALTKLENVLDSKFPLYASEKLFTCAVSLRSTLMDCAYEPHNCNSKKIRSLTIVLGRDARASISEEWNSNLQSWDGSGFDFCPADRIGSPMN